MARRDRRDSSPARLQEEEEERGPFEEEDGLVVPNRRFFPLVDALGDDREFLAVATEDKIKDLVKALIANGDRLAAESLKNLRSESEYETSFAGSLTAKLKSAFQVIDDVLNFLEYTGHKMLEDLKSREGVLRGILGFSELAFQLEIFQFLKIFVKYIDVPEDPYLAERSHIIKTLEYVQSQEENIEVLVERAGEILKSIIDQEALEESTALQFDNVIREATLKINICRKTLGKVEPVIKDLLRKANTAKWVSRSARLSCLGISCIYLYGKYHETKISLPIALAGGMVTGFAWLALFPNNAYQLTDALRNLLFMNEQLYDKLEHIHEVMESTQSQKVKLT